MREEDSPALDWKEVEELRKKIIEEEEAKRRAAEAEEEDEEEADEDEEDGDGDGHGDDDDDNYWSHFEFKIQTNLTRI